ncbi:MAG: type I DNA topoisomerase [Candidatus Sumerlaeaceae bacterium]
MPLRKTKTKEETAADGAAPKRAARKTTAKAAGATTSPRKISARKKPVESDGASSGGAGRSLVIVESPAKAKTLKKYLGADFKIEASIGHVKDLPKSKLGVDIDNNFEPQYVVMDSKQKVIDRIRKSAEGVERIFLAPDPDREGEAIAWHIADELKTHGVRVPMYRATFNEITKRAVQEAIANPSELNEQLYEAQQARRILDRLVGYKLSPLLWKKVMFGLSAGRVQSVAVRLVVERERDIDAFVPEEYWSIEADVAAKSPPPFTMKLAQVEGSKPVLSNRSDVETILRDLGAAGLAERVLGEEGVSKSGPERKALTGRLDYQWTVSSIESKDVRRKPAVPFITSTLQQEASRKLYMGAKRTMSIAQKLYEGVELAGMGQTALITYMRTDSTRIGNEAMTAVREYIQRTYGDRYLPDAPRNARVNQGAQDAHECVRPTDMALTPEVVEKSLDAEQLKLYTLIWNRFVASQMEDAIFEQTRVESAPRSGYLFTATGQVQKFAGFLAVYEEGQDDKATDDANAKLPAMEVGDTLNVQAIHGDQHFTQPPPRYSEASLVKELEKRGIGRPSTYASIVSTIAEKYVQKDDGKKFRPSELGYVVTDLLVENFPEVMDVDFTKGMEERLDRVEDGSVKWKNLLGEFYDGFSKRLDSAATNMRAINRESTPTEIKCDKCGEANMVIKFGRNGRFLACPRYPECKNTHEYTTTEGGTVEAVEVVQSDELCENCGRRMIVKNGRHGRFLACPGYPECKSVKSFKTGVKCPLCKDGDLVERMSKKGKMFFSCSRYPECKHVEWNRPMPQNCPRCGNYYMLLREGKKRILGCPKCRYAEELPEQEPAVSAAAQ